MGDELERLEQKCDTCGQQVTLLFVPPVPVDAHFVGTQCPRLDCEGELQEVARA